MSGTVLASGDTAVKETCKTLHLERGDDKDLKSTDIRHFPHLQNTFTAALGHCLIESLTGYHGLHRLTQKLIIPATEAYVG